MSALSPKAAARTAAAVAMAAGMAVCLSAGTAQANPGDRLGSDKDRVILKAPTSKAAAASLSLSANAPRLVGGAGARVVATYNCPSTPGNEGFLDVGLHEVTGNVVAHGSGSNMQPLICDGTNRNLRVSVVVYNDYPFKKGKALGQGFLYTIDGAGVVSSATTERTINIT